MKRIKKLTIQTILIVILLFILYYFGGYYISKEECIRDTLRSHYAKESTILMTLGNGKYDQTLVAEPDENTYSIVGTKRKLFLYRPGNSSISHKINTNKALDIMPSYSEEMGSIIFLYRNNPSIEKIEVILTDGTTFVLDEWHANFTGYYLDADAWRSNTYKAYDASNQLIYETTW